MVLALQYLSADQVEQSSKKQEEEKQPENQEPEKVSGFTGNILPGIQREVKSSLKLHKVYQTY